MPKYDLDDLLGALNAVASSSDPDSGSEMDVMTIQTPGTVTLMTILITWTILKT
jgi:hypothetical protein